MFEYAEPFFPASIDKITVYGIIRLVEYQMHF